MAKPKIFISSTYYDLKHVRSSLEDFINELGYESILSESGNISYEHTVPLDTSCYKEASNADIFVLIIGGRYGSPTSNEGKTKHIEFFEKYESVTKEEYQTAFKKDIPIYILIEKQVYAEYQTYKKNKDNKNINYAHVDSINIFHFIDEIFDKPRNNATYQFEKHSEIKDWLREQWAGKFRDLLHQRTENQQYKSLNSKIEELSSINTSMKKYLETIMKASTKNSEEIIKSENSRQKNQKIIRDLYDKTTFSSFSKHLNIEEDTLIEIFSEATSLDKLATDLASYSNLSQPASELLTAWKEMPMPIQNINHIREILGKDSLHFKDEK